MKVKAIRTAVFPPLGDLLLFIGKYLPKISEGSIVVVTSKIVALSEGRLVDKIDDKTKMKIIKQESDIMIYGSIACLTVKDGIAMVNAGVDESNGNGKIILLPKDSYKAATKIRNFLKIKYKLNNVGVIITDSRTWPLRAGITGAALGYAGFEGLKKYYDQLDIFGRPFKYSRVNVADSLATAAVFCMGEGDEQQPLAVITGALVKYVDRIDRNELKIDIKEDIYGPLFRKIK
jgi:F420-0:gamma-glutamyl ligase